VMPAIAGVLVRGATVIVVMSVLLWLTGFFNADELRVLKALRTRGPSRERTAPAETTELAGEIVAVEVPDNSFQRDAKDQRNEHKLS